MKFVFVTKMQANFRIIPETWFQWLYWGRAGVTGPGFTESLLVPSHPICIRVSYSTGPLFPVG